MRIVRMIKQAVDDDRCGGGAGCTGGNCPTVMVCDDGNALVQGFVLDPEIRRSVQVPDGEDVVCMSLETLKNLAAQLL